MQQVVGVFGFVALAIRRVFDVFHVRRLKTEQESQIPIGKAAFADDVVVVVLYNKTEDIFTTNRSVSRDSETLQPELPSAFTGQEFHVWVFTQHREGFEVSTSQYVGTVVDRLYHRGHNWYCGSGDLAVSTVTKKSPEELIPDPDAAKKLLKLRWISCGDQDNLVRFSEQTHDYLTANEIPHVYYVLFGGKHDFEVWKNSLYQFSTRIFKPTDLTK